MISWVQLLHSLGSTGAQEKTEGWRNQEKKKHIVPSLAFKFIDNVVSVFRPSSGHFTRQWGWLSEVGLWTPVAQSARRQTGVPEKEKQLHLRYYRDRTTYDIALRSKPSRPLGSMVWYFKKGPFHNKIHNRHHNTFLSCPCFCPQKHD